MGDDGRNVHSHEDYRPLPVEENADQGTRRPSNLKTSIASRRQETATMAGRTKMIWNTRSAWRRKRSAWSKTHEAALTQRDTLAVEARGGVALVSAIEESEERAGESMECCVWVARGDGCGGKVTMDAPCGGGGAWCSEEWGFRAALRDG